MTNESEFEKWVEKQLFDWEHIEDCDLGFHQIYEAAVSDVVNKILELAEANAFYGVHEGALGMQKCITIAKLKKIVGRE